MDSSSQSEPGTVVQVSQASKLGLYAVIIIAFIALIGFVILFLSSRYSSITNTDTHNLIPTTEVSITPTLPIPTKSPDEIPDSELGNPQQKPIEKEYLPYRDLQ